MHRLQTASLDKPSLPANCVVANTNKFPRWAPEMGMLLALRASGGALAAVVRV